MAINLKQCVNRPFSIQPNPNLIGIDEEKNKLKSYIENGDICFLYGNPGVGKSSLLKWLGAELKGHKVIYLDAKETYESFRLDSHIKQNLPFWRRLLNKYPKNLVFLLDEAQAADLKLIEPLEVLWNKGIIKSIVLTQIKPHLPNCPDSFMNRLGKRTIHLDRMNIVRVHELIKLRTNGQHPFSDDAIEIIAEKSSYIPRKVLENCHIALIELGNKEKISASDVKFILDQKEAEELEIGAMELDETAPNETVLIPLESIENVKGISPMEERILKLLLENAKTSIQLSTILNTTVGSVGKQLSKLIKTNIVEVTNTRRPKLYGLTREFKQSLTPK